jgi:hypothetical protein
MAFAPCGNACGADWGERRGTQLSDAPHDTTPGREIPESGAIDTRDRSALSLSDESAVLQALLMPEEGLEPPTRGL